MPSTTAVTVPQLIRMVGLPGAPAILDIRTEDDYNADPRLLPASYRRDFKTVQTWAADFAGGRVAVVCQQGKSSRKASPHGCAMKGSPPNRSKAASKPGGTPTAFWSVPTGCRLVTTRAAPSG